MKSNIFRSTGAVLAGIVFIVITHTLVDNILEQTGVLPKGNLHVGAGLIWVVIAYRAILSVVGCYITARIAPQNPMKHSLIVGGIGTVASIGGAIANQTYQLGPAWYAWTLAAMALPIAWIAGKMYEQRTTDNGQRTKDFVAFASITIHAPLATVWNAFVDPAIIKQYMFGTTVKSEWKEGSVITWSGEWQGKHYEDKGEIVRLVPQKMLEYTHFSSMSGRPNILSNYHHVSVAFEQTSDGVNVELTQSNNESSEVSDHSASNWRMMLEGLKKLLEQ